MAKLLEPNFFSDGQNLMYHLNDVNTIILFLFDVITKPFFLFHFY